MSRRSEYVKRQIVNHVRLFFTSEAQEFFNSFDITFATLEQALGARKLAIIIPTDIPLPESLEKPYPVEFNGTKLTLWRRIDYSLSEEWTAIPNDDSPLWYQHQSGTVIPACNMFATLFDLLTCGEERREPQRDSHNRFIGEYSQRDKFGSLEVPVFNEAVAAMVAAVAGLNNNGTPQFHLRGLLKPPVAVLSHDCDILLGNDFWTQMVRGYRVILPLRRFRLPTLTNVWWIIRNYLTPRRFYFDNVTGMIDLERIFGFKSTFYLINGSTGRFGARSGAAILKELVTIIPDGWDVGLHYNYDTYLNEQRFQGQFAELSGIVSNKIECGRAHYLRFDSNLSPSFLEAAGISVDESAGYPDRVGYRCGVGGCVSFYDPVEERELGIYNVPLNVMEATLMNQYGSVSIAAFRRLLRHTARIGGALSVLVHPGQFHNPEFPQMLDLYHQMLQELRDVKAVSRTALSLAKELG